MGLGEEIHCSENGNKVVHSIFKVKSMLKSL
jgi:hypothetical protein